MREYDALAAGSREQAGKRFSPAVTVNEKAGY